MANRLWVGIEILFLIGYPYLLGRFESDRRGVRTEVASAREQVTALQSEIAKLRADSQRLADAVDRRVCTAALRQ